MLEVYRCVQLKKWSVVCGCVLHRGQRGEGWCVSSTLCRYEGSEGVILGACWCISLLWLRCMRCVCTMLVCICVEFAEICCCVTVSGCVSMLVV